MQATSFAAMLQDGSGMLHNALHDPGVETLARSLHLDLNDPATRKRLLAVTQQYVDASSEVSLGQKRMLTQELTPGLSGYSRDAIRTYLQIAAMN